MEEVQRRLKAAQEALEKQDYGAVGRHCKHVLKQDRDNHEAYIIFGKAFMAQKQAVHADKAFRKAIDTNSASLPAWQGLVELYEETGEKEKLLEALEEACKLAESAGDGILLQTLTVKLAALRTGDSSGGEAPVSSSLETDATFPAVPDDAELGQLIQKVVSLKGVGGDEWQKAKLALLENCIAMTAFRPSELAFQVGLALCEEDESDELFNALGFTHIGADRISRIEWFGQRCHHFYPEHGFGLAAIALGMHERTWDFQKQVSLLQRALQLESSCVFGWHLLAVVHLDLGAGSDAVKCINHGLGAVSSWRATFGLSLVLAELRFKLILARASLSLKLYVDADQTLQAVLEGARAVPDDSLCFSALEELAKVSIAQGNLEEAWSRLGSVVSLYPHSHWAIAELGWQSYKKGQLSEAVRCLEQAVALSPDVALYHHRLGLVYSNGGESLGYSRSMVLKQLMQAATLDPGQAAVFRDLGHHFRAVQGTSQQAISCYHKAVMLDADDAEAGQALCDILSEQGQETVAAEICHTVTEHSASAYWAWRHRGLVQVQQQDWSGATSSLQHALRGYPQDAQSWEALGLAYRQLGMLTAALKAYSGVLALESCSPLFALLESGAILLTLSMFSKAIDTFRLALEKCPSHVVARCGLASALLGRSRECLGLGAFAWSTALLEEAGKIAGELASASSYLVTVWKLWGDIQTTYTEAVHCEAVDIKSSSVVHGLRGQTQHNLLRGIQAWHDLQLGAARDAKRAYQHALHMCPSQSNLYVDLGLSLERLNRLKGMDDSASQMRLDLVCGGIQLEGGNPEYWIALGVLMDDKRWKQHALIQALRIDGDHSLAWALLGQLYLMEGNQELAIHAFDRARSSDPLLALPWAGMSFIHSLKGSKDKLRDAVADCLYAIHLSPTTSVQLGLAKLAADTRQLNLLQVYVALEQVIQRVPQCPEAHNLKGLACESRSDFHAAIEAFRTSRTVLEEVGMARPDFSQQHFAVSINLARALCKAGKMSAAVQEYEKLAATGSLAADRGGMCGYAVALWWNGQKDVAIATMQQAAGSKNQHAVSSRSVISLMSRLLYFKFGPSPAIREMQRASQLDYSVASFCFTALALAISSRQSHVFSSLLPFCSKVFEDERASEFHELQAVGRQILYQGDSKLVSVPLLKALHLRPHDALLRSKLGRIILENSSGQVAELAIRCCHATFSLSGTSAEHEETKTLASAALACGSCRSAKDLPPFSACHGYSETPAIWIQLQRWLHREPWNILPHVYLISESLQQARGLGYPCNLCRAILRMCQTALSLLETLESSKANHRLRIHLLVCASESALQSGQEAAAVEFARTASGQTPAASDNRIADLQLARCYAVGKNSNLLRNEVKMLLTSMQPDDTLGWVVLASILELYGLHQDSPSAINTSENAIQKISPAERRVWSAVLQLVRAQGFLQEEDLTSAERAAASALAICPNDSVLGLLHGALALGLAKVGAGAEFWTSATRSLRRASIASGQCSLPIAQALLAQAEAGSGSSNLSASGISTKVEKHIRSEWSCWPAGYRPAELYFQMSLLAKKSNGASKGAVDGPETLHTAKSWLQHAVHLNPSSARYWNSLRT